MKSSKWILGLMVAVLVVALAPSSFAQVNIQIFNTPSPGEVATAHNAQTSDPASVGNGILVSGALIANSPLTATGLIFTFPAPITSSAATTTCVLADGTSVAATCPGPGAIPAADPLRIDGATGLFAGAAIATVNWGAGTVNIVLPGSAANTSSGTFRLVGTRIEVNGKTAPLTASASLSSSSNNYILQTTSVPIISSLGPGLGPMTIGTNGTNTNNGTALLFTNQTTASPADALASVILAEGFASAWRTTSQTNTQGVDAAMNGNMVRLTISGLPAGVQASLTIAGTGGTSNTIPGGNTGAVFLATDNDTVVLTNASSSTSVAYIKFKSTNLAAVETLQINITLSGTPTAALAAGAITLTATMGPVGNALNSSGQPTQTVGGTGNPAATGGLSGQAYPRFAQADVSVTIASIVSEYDLADSICRKSWYI